MDKGVRDKVFTRVMLITRSCIMYPVKISGIGGIYLNYVSNSNLYAKVFNNLL